MVLRHKHPHKFKASPEIGNSLSNSVFIKLHDSLRCFLDSCYMEDTAAITSQKECSYRSYFLKRVNVVLKGIWSPMEMISTSEENEKDKDIFGQILNNVTNIHDRLVGIKHMADESMQGHIKLMHA